MALAALMLFGASSVAADSEISSTGSYGAHRLRDVFGYPGARCDYPSASAQNETAIRVRSPIVFARNATAGQLDYQTVGWRARLQELRSGVWVTIASSPLQKQPATDIHSAEFSPRTFTVSTAGRHRVMVDMYWYSPTGTTVVGQSRHRVDFYAIVVDGEQVFQNDHFC